MNSKAVEDGRLFRFRFDALRHQIRIRHRPFGRVEQQLLQLPNRDLGQILLVRQQIARFGDQRRIAIKRRVSFAGRFDSGVMLRT